MSHIGLFIDLDNAQLEAAKLGLTHCRNSALWVGALIAELERVTGGSVTVRRAYRDVLLNTSFAFRDTWNVKALRGQITSDLEMQRDLVNKGFQVIHCPTIGRKNRADIMMALDCMELASSSTVKLDAFAVLSQDSDFSALLHRLRALGKDVILITVGRPAGRSWRTLEALASQWVIYDQAMIDRAGFEPLHAVIAQLQEAEPAEALRQGIALSVVHSRITQLQPAFAYESMGFDRLSDFIDACIDPPFERRNNELVIPKPAPAAGEIVAATTGQPSADRPNRDQQLLALLNRQSLRPMPELRRAIGRWLRAEAFDANGRPRSSTYYGEIMDRIEAEFAPKGFSKSQIADARCGC